MKYLNYVFSVAAGLLLAGCVTSGVATSGLPKGAQMVGGGLNIEWRAPESGTAILVEQTSHKVVKTGHVAPNTFPGFLFNANGSIDGPAVRGMFPAAKLSELQFVLYYVPDSTIISAKDQP